MTSKKLKSEPAGIAFDETLGAESFERVRPLLAEIPTEQVLRVNVDLQSAAIAAWGIGRLVERPEIRKRFASLPAEEFDVGRLDLLRELALAAWYARSTAQAETEKASSAKVSADLAEEGATTKQRMMRVVEFALADDPSAQAALEQIRPGIGYVDLAADLTHLALLYTRHEAELKKLGIAYRADDVPRARSIATRVLDQLGNKSGTDWGDLTARLWTLLRQVHEDVRSAGQFLFRAQPLEGEFVSLYSATRARPRGSTASNDGEAAVATPPVVPGPAPALVAVPAASPVVAPATGPVNGATLAAPH